MDELLEQGTRQLAKSLELKQQNIGSINKVLSSLNPQNVLSRGYSIISTNDGKVLTSYAQFDTISENEDLRVRFNDGEGRVKKKSD